MSTEYIERGALLEGLKFPTREEIEKRYIEIEADQQPLDVLVDTMLAISRVYLEKVEGAPAADVEPVVHAHWEHNGSEFPDRIICSNCKRRYDMMRWEPEDFDRCPHCGAHMDERSEGK